MYDFLSYSSVDREIQNRMSSQAPSESKRIEAVLSVLDELSTQYDLETTVRKETISAIANGSNAYDLYDLLDNDDLKRIKSIRFPSDDDDQEPLFMRIDQEEFYHHVAEGRHINEYTTFYEDGELMININTGNNSSTAISLECLYYSIYNVIAEDGTFQADITSVDTDKILVPLRFKPLIVAGALVKLWPMALGDDGEAKASRNFNFYKDQLIKLGLDKTGSDIKREQKKIRIRHPYRVSGGRRIISS